MKSIARNSPTTDKALRAQMLAGISVTERRLDVGGVATTVLEAGEGPALVLLHGGIECGGAYWAPVIARLAERHHVVVPDVPGLGVSAPVERLDAGTFGAWFGGVLAQMKADRPTVVAHSLLGSVVARHVAQHRDAVGNLVVYAAPGVGPYRMPMGLRYAAIRFAIRPTTKNADRFERFALLDLDATRALDPEWFAAFREYTRRQAAIPHVKRTMRRLIGPATKPIPDELLAAITTPTTLLWGRHDRMVPLHIAQHAAASFGWPLQIVEGAAHVPHLEQPEAFLRALSNLEEGRRA